VKPSRYLGAALLLLMMVGVGWQAWRSVVVSAPMAPVVPQVASHPQRVLGVVTASAEAVVARLSADSDAPGELRPQASPTGASAPAGGETVLDLCGVGPLRVKLPQAGEQPSSFELLPNALGVYARSAAWPRVLAAMESMPGDRSRAAALVLKASGLLDAEATLSQLTLPSVDVSRWQSELALLAKASSDAAVLRWALAVCLRDPTAPACQTLSRQDLVRLAPDDGSHWLAVAATPGATTTEREAALRRAAAASRFTSMPSLAMAVDAALPPDLPGYLRQDLLVQVIGVEAAFPDDTMFNLSNHCRTASANDRRDLCLALADRLAAQGEDLTSLAVARSIGKRLGWSDARVESMRAEESVLTGTLLNKLNAGRFL
jgi:hypothetical protein